MSQTAHIDHERAERCLCLARHYDAEMLAPYIRYLERWLDKAKGGEAVIAHAMNRIEALVDAA